MFACCNERIEHFRHLINTIEISPWSVTCSMSFRWTSDEQFPHFILSAKKPNSTILLPSNISCAFDFGGVAGTEPDSLVFFVFLFLVISQIFSIVFPLINLFPFNRSTFLLVADPRAIFSTVHVHNQQQALKQPTNFLKCDVARYFFL